MVSLPQTIHFTPNSWYDNTNLLAGKTIQHPDYMMEKRIDMVRDINGYQNIGHTG